jgi:hypothetical protein
LKKESHAQNVAVEGDCPFNVAYRDGYLPDFIQPEVGCCRLGHEWSSVVSKSAHQN